MQGRNLYKVLQVSPTASAADIKKAWRKLAQQYHPDKNDGNTTNVERFNEAKAAYEVLSDERKRQHYHYYEFDIYFAADKQITPFSILQDCLQLERWLEHTPARHIEYDIVYLHIYRLLYPDGQPILEACKATSEATGIISSVVKSSRVLPYTYSVKLFAMMYPYAGEEQLKYMQQQLEQQKKQAVWEKYKVLFAVIITVVLCGLLYWLSHR